MRSHYDGSPKGKYKEDFAAFVLSQVACDWTIEILRRGDGSWTREKGVVTITRRMALSINRREGT
jgi:hypothetical protein